MNPLHYSTLIFLLCTVSYASRIETTSDDHDNIIKLFSSNDGDSSDLLSTVTTTPVSHNKNKLPYDKTVSSVDDLTQFMNRYPAHFRNRFMSPRRRCHNRFSRFAPRIQVDDVWRKFGEEEGKINEVEPEFFIPLELVHFNHGDIDPTVEIKRDENEYEVKHEYEYEGEWKRDGHHYDHEEKENDIVKKIRKFLSHF